MNTLKLKTRLALSAIILIYATPSAPALAGAEEGAVELSEAHQVGRLMVFPSRTSRSWILPTAFRSALGCSPATGSEFQSCNLRLFNSASGTEEVALRALRAAGSSPFGAIQEGPGSPLLQSERRIESSIPLVGRDNPLLIDPLQFRPEKNWFGSVAYRSRSNEDRSIPLLFQNEGLGELTVSVHLRAKRTHELLALRDASGLSALRREAEDAGIPRDELATRLASLVSADQLILFGIQQDEARVLAPRLIQWRFLSLSSNDRYYWKTGAEIGGSSGGAPVILMESVQKHIELRCLIRFPLRDQSLPETNCTEEGS